MSEPRKKITLPYLFKKVADGEPITWLTCYDYPTAYLQEQAGIESPDRHSISGATGKPHAL